MANKSKVKSQHTKPAQPKRKKASKRDRRLRLMIYLMIFAMLLTSLTTGLLLFI